MSFDVWVTAFRDGKVTTFPRASVEDAFGPFATRTKPERWDLSFPDGGGGVLRMDDDQLITGFGVNRPPGSPLFWQAMLDVLKSAPTVLYWPGGGCVTATLT